MEFSLGKQIVYFRKQQGMTQEQLAQQLGITNQAVSKWEQDQSCPDIQLLPRLADLFGITLDTLFGREEPAPVAADLPWEDDGELRAVLYIGRKLQKKTLLKRGEREKVRVEFCYDGPALNITSEFAVSCSREVMGSVTAGDGVICGTVYGNVTAGDGIQCGNIGGNAGAGDSINCGSIGGNAKAGDSINCTSIGGDAHASDGIHLRK